MNISQDSFNKLVTIVLMTFFMGMYVVSFITGKHLDVEGMLGFLIPTLNHVVHQITQAQMSATSINASTQKEVAKITTNGTSANH